MTTYGSIMYEIKSLYERARMMEYPFIPDDTKHRWVMGLEVYCILLNMISCNFINTDDFKPDRLYDIPITVDNSDKWVLKLLRSI